MKYYPPLFDLVYQVDKSSENNIIMHFLHTSKGYYDYKHLIFGFGGIGLQIPDLQLAIFAYFDQYLVRKLVITRKVDNLIINNQCS